MPRCTVALLARSVSVDPFTNSLTAVEVAENLNVEAPELPPNLDEAPHLIAPFSWVFIALFLREDLAVPEDLVGRLNILCPDGRAFPGPEQRIDLVNAPNARSLTMIPAFPFCGNGLYRFRYEIRVNNEWSAVTEYPLPLTMSVRTEDKAGS